MKHSWSSGNEGAPACLRCSEMQTPENIEADNCGERGPYHSYLDDLDYLARRIAELRAEREAMFTNLEK